MTAKVITVLNQKGGVGKTTLSMHLAASLQRRDYRVIVADADPQGTAVRWSAAAPDDAPFPVPVMSLSAANNRIHTELVKYADDYQYIVVDCPPAVESAIPQSALLVSHLAILPIIPSPPDMWAAVKVKDLIESVSVMNDKLKTMLVINQMQPNTKIAQAVREILPEFEMPLAKTSLHLRTAYRQAAAIGGTVYNIGRSAQTAINEIDALTAEILTYIEG